MIVIRLIHLKDMPSYETILKELNENKSSQSNENVNNSVGGEFHLNEKKEKNETPKNQIKNTIQIKPDLTSLSSKNFNKDPNLENISSFEDLIQLSSKKKEIELKYDLERNVNLIKFSDGKIDIGFNENIGKNFVRNLSEKLLEWTGKRWVITLTKKTGQKTFLELQALSKKQLLEEEKKGEVYKKFKNIFSDIELVEVSKKD